MTQRTLDDACALIRANLRPVPVPGLEPLVLWTADALTPIWEATEADLERQQMGPPFWAFPWVGGQAVSRFIRDNPQTVSGKRVLDLACGNGIIALTALMQGAALAQANDIDPMCEAAVALNGELNGVTAQWRGGDLLDGPAPEVDVVFAGDVFYERGMAERFIAWLRRAREAGCEVYVGDPGRTYFPAEGLEQVADYAIDTTLEIESTLWKTTRVWRV